MTPVPYLKGLLYLPKILETFSKQTVPLVDHQESHGCKNEMEGPTVSPPLAHTEFATHNVGMRPAMLENQRSHRGSCGMGPCVKNIIATFGTANTSLHFL